ncbi:MAG: ABC transporter permease subunit [Eubacteriales bacterium]|nr:ABC transporter permease subunit [Eubacteriales bacterium]
MSTASPSLPKRSWKTRLVKALKRDKFLLLMFLPIVVYYVVFSYVPMTGAIVAFKQFKPGHGIYGGDWVGLKWFIQFFKSPFAFRTVRNTVLISIYSILFGFPLPILFAICVTEIRSSKVRRVVQTVSYLPHFISTVVLVGMINNFFSMNHGLVNDLIVRMGGEPVNFLINPAWFRTLYVGSGVWQNFGFNSIIYIAAITGIDPSLYEAGKIDGITKFQEMVYITIPMISQTIVMLFIMQLGGIMSVGFEKVFLMYSPAVYETADVVSTYVYRKGIESNNYGFGSAVGLFNSVINFAFVFIANQVCRKLTDSSLW